MTGIARMADIVFSLYELGLLAYVLCGWVVHPGSRRVRLWLAPWYEPLLAPIRRFLLPIAGSTGFDFSPVVLFVALGLVRRLVMSIFATPF